MLRPLTHEWAREGVCQLCVRCRAIDNSESLLLLPQSRAEKLFSS